MLISCRSCSQKHYVHNVTAVVASFWRCIWRFCEIFSEAYDEEIDMLTLEERIRGMPLDIEESLIG